MEAPASPFDRKRRRGLDDDGYQDSSPLDKKARPTTVQGPDSDERLWYPRDSVISSSSHPHAVKAAKYDSDDQSSLVSEPGSPQALSQVSDEDVSMHSDGEDLGTLDGLVKPQTDVLSPTSAPSSSPWRSHLQMNRVATPILSPRTAHKLLQGHVRQRHPQEVFSSDRLDVPSPIDEDEISTPPSAAEAAGSQLELLSVSDVEMHSSEPVPKIAVDTERSLQLDGSPDEASDFDQMDSTSESIAVRKTRARSGALSAGDGSPMRESAAVGLDGGFGGRRGFSMGFRADCDKCQQRVPGHMNHFY